MPFHGSSSHCAVLISDPACSAFLHEGALEGSSEGICSWVPQHGAWAASWASMAQKCTAFVWVCERLVRPQLRNKQTVWPSGGRTVSVCNSHLWLYDLPAGLIWGYIGSSFMVAFEWHWTREEVQNATRRLCWACISFSSLVSNTCLSVSMHVTDLSKAEFHICFCTGNCL